MTHLVKKIGMNKNMITEFKNYDKVDYIKCHVCNGDGFYADHSSSHYHSPYDICSDHGCPVQVECEYCEGQGKIKIIRRITEDDPLGEENWME